MRAIGYIRVSTQRQVAEGVSIEAQEAKVRAWAEANSATETIIFRDEGISGKKMRNRPGLAAALKAVGKGDALVAYSLSRLSRSIRDALTISDALAKKGADLVSLSEKIDTTSAAGKMVFNMMAVLAEFEREQIAERTKLAMAHKRAKGEKTGGDVPFGYRLEDGVLVEDANEQKAVALIRRLRAKGYTFRAIGRELEAEGHRTKTGKTSWHPQVVKNIIDQLERKAA